ncbi:hypothetical protein PoB_006309200 [Plakobranchus ocellatus]|uniref:Uncharacterized protein n=1 Tax=Plakobranchus ocellatus TaxID=259542 RepID=A0AAV4CXG1_9GAST|nr:hypothetical protein PoB_006309200 [Plakobranchus ocellatus]
MESQVECMNHAIGARIEFSAYNPINGRHPPARRSGATLTMPRAYFYFKRSSLKAGGGGIDGGDDDDDDDDDDYGDFTASSINFQFFLSDIAYPTSKVI